MIFLYKKMILYIEDLKYKAILYQENTIQEFCSINNCLDKLAQINLFSISAYRKAVRKTTTLKAKAPIYFNKKLLLFKLNNYYINYFSISKILFDNKLCKIAFNNGEILHISVTKHIFDVALDRTNMIIKYKEGLDE